MLKNVQALSLNDNVPFFKIVLLLLMGACRTEDDFVKYTAKCAKAISRALNFGEYDKKFPLFNEAIKYVCGEFYDALPITYLK